MKSEISPTWILFASGNSVKVELSLYDPATDRSRPIAAYMVSDVGSDIARSASRAAETVFAIAHELKLAPPPTVAGFDLQGLRNGSQVAGSSSGLALALALAKKIWPEHDPGPIAATGAITGPTGGGQLQEIAQFANKAQAALALLNHGGLFFYPRDNDHEISSELKNDLQKNGIQIFPVGSVAEALAIAMPKIFSPEKPVVELAASATPKKTAIKTPACLTTAAILLAVIAAGGLYFSRGGWESATRPKAVAPISAADRKPVSELKKQTPKTADRDRIKIKVEIGGSSNLEKDLAQQTNSRLKALIDADKQALTGLESISGRVVILFLSESRNPADDSLTSRIKTTFLGQAVFKNLTRQAVSIKPITCSGSGYVRQQLADTATLLVESIDKSLHELPTSELLKSDLKTDDNKPKNNKDITINRPNQGFE